MTDFSFLDTPIEIAAESPRREMIMSRLRATGLRPFAASDPIDFNVAEALLIDVETATPEMLARFSRAQMIGFSRQIIILGPAPAEADIPDTIFVRRDNDLSVLKERLTAMKRQRSRALEVATRIETLTEMGGKLPGIDPDASPEILYLGDSSPLFLKAQSSLKARGIPVTAALTMNTARDFLSQNRFSALLLDLTSTCDRAQQLINWTAPENSITGLPILALVDSELDMTDAQRANLAYASDLIDLSQPLQIITDKIERLTRRYLATAPILPTLELSSTTADFTTGLFARKFMECHLEKQMQMCQDAEEALSMMTLKVSGKGASDRSVLKTLSNTVKSLLRETDCAAYMGTSVVGVSLPFTPYRGGVRLAERIVQTIARHQELSELKIEWRVVERRAYHTSKSLLSAGTAGPFMRNNAA